jgi:AraC-like DNA-binding protein
VKPTIKSGVFQQSFDKREWHYHDSYELIMISEGTGQRIVGDQMSGFEPGDLLFMGRNLPHLWISDPVHIDPGSDRCVETIFVQFEDSLFNDQMIHLPEFAHVRAAIEKSSRGCSILGKTRDVISGLMMQVPYLDGFGQIINLLTILNEIGQSSAIHFLASEQYSNPVQITASKRVQTIRNHCIKNHQQPVNLNELANMVSMQPASLCRMFKQETGLTITEYQNRVRIDLASKMLMNGALKIEEIAYECGYNTISFFNRQFKKIHGISPNIYRKRNFSA